MDRPPASTERLTVLSNRLHCYELAPRPGRMPAEAKYLQRAS